MPECPTKRPSFDGVPENERGFLLLAVLFMVLLLTLVLATAAPKIATELRRTKEQEAVRRGEQYERAIGLYYRKFGHYPNSIKELLNSNGERFLRRKYLDPFTGKDDWTLIHPGQAQMLGMPGQPSPGAVNGGMTGGTMPGSSPLGGSGMGNSGLFSSTTGPGSGIGGRGIGGSPFGTSSPQGSSGTTGADGGDSFANPGSNIGAGPIIGVGLPVKQKSFKVIHGKDHYNQWQFVFDPAKQMLKAAGIPTQSGGQNGMGQGINSGFGGGGSFGNPSSGPGSGFGNSGFGNSGFGGSSGFGNSGMDGSGMGNPPSQPNR